MEKSLSPEKLSTLLQRTEFFKKYKLQVLLVFVGIILLTTGFLFFKNLNLGGGVFPQGDKVEVLGEATKTETLAAKEIVVEISGAVQKAGVYSLPMGSRVNDLLVAGSGLSADADRDWVDKNINKAAKLVDGQKLYIPFAKEVGTMPSEGNTNEPRGSGLVNINTASLSELDTLPGIGQTYGSNIIVHRPYSTIEELVSKKAISQSVFEKIKDKISVY